MQSQMVIHLLAAATLMPDPKNPRKAASSEDSRLELRLLGQDMKRRGVLVPLLVRRNGDMYLVIDGHRRREAALLVGIEKLPCVVFEKDVTEAEVREAQLVTQLHSQALTPYEVYCGARNWMSHHPNSAAKDLSIAISRSEGYVSQVLSLDRCAPSVRDAAARGLIGLKDWYAISQGNEQQQAEMLSAKLNGTPTADLKRVGQRNGSTVRTAKLKCAMPGGVTVTLAAQGEGVSLDEVEETLVALLKEVRKGKDQGLDSKAFSAVMRDKAKA